MNKISLPMECKIVMSHVLHGIPIGSVTSCFGKHAGKAISQDCSHGFTALTYHPVLLQRIVQSICTKGMICCSGETDGAFSMTNLS